MPAESAAPRLIRRICSLAVLLLLAAAPAAHASGDARLLVRFDAGVSPSQVRAVLAGHGARELETIGQIDVHVVSVPAARADAVRAALGRRADVRFAERDGLRTIAESVPNDYWWPNQWSQQKARVTRAWDVTPGSSSVVIAVLDTGVSTGPDLADNLVAGYDAYSNDNDPTDENGHGTNGAGVAAGRSSNGVGVAGVCGRCSIMPVKVSGPDGAIPTSTSAAGITWAADHGADVINMSYAGPASSSAEASAVQYAIGKGVVVIASAGNYSSSSPYYPAANAGVVGVAATESTDALASYSNYGSWVAVAAPGCSRSIQRTGTFTDFCGTSSAAPFVAGVAGLALSAAPSASGSQVAQALQSGAVPVGSFVRYGRVDAWGTLAALGVAWAGNAGAPQSTAAPTFVAQGGGPLSSPQSGQWIGGTVGAWTGAAGMSFSWQWRRCDAAGASCVTATTGSAYQVASTDAGRTVRVAVTATNGSGSATAVSAPLAIGGSTTGVAPQSTAAPVISGTPQSGSALSASTGSWSGSPTSYAYRWQRCDSSLSGCSDIAGATAAGYGVTDADVGSALRVIVVAGNAYGSASATSAATSAVTAADPAPTAGQDTFSGTLTSKTTSQSFTVTAGAGDATATLTYAGGKVSGMTLKLLDASGATLGSVSGSSGMQLTRTLAAGTYRYVVSGESSKGSTTFTLAVEHAS